MFSVEKAWKTMLSHIYKLGDMHHKDDAMIKEYLGMHVRIRNPLFDKAFAFSNPSAKFVSWMEAGAFDIEGYPMKGQALADYVTSLDDDYMIDGTDFVYTYPERLKGILVADESGLETCVNQVDVIVNRLLENTGSNRAVATLYQAGLDGERVDIPCLNWLQVTVRNNTMVLHVMFRSNDIYGAWPSNMYFLTYLGLQIQERLNKDYPMITFKYIDYHVSSAHVYETDFDAVEKIVKDFKINEVL